MIVIDETYERLNEKLRGKKPKLKLQKDGIKYIFKYGAINYEIWAELIAEQLGKQVGIEMAHYEIANFNGTIGLLTPVFLKENELILSNDYLKKSANYLFEENNLIGDLKENTIVNIIQAAFTLDHSINTQDLGYELMKRWLFFTLIMESDKNETNIGFIKGRNGIRLSPDYDNSSMARLNENITNFIDVMRTGFCDIRPFTDNIKNSLRLTEQNNGLFLHDFEIFSKKYPNQCNDFLQIFSKIDIAAAIEIVEQNNQVEVPWEVKFWLDKVITARLDDMNSIYKNINKKNKNL